MYLQHIEMNIEADVNDFKWMFGNREWDFTLWENPGAQAHLKGTGGSLKKFRLKEFRFRILHCEKRRRPSPPERYWG